jgi:hypothetical protein
VIDYGLLISMIIAFGVPTFLVRWWSLSSYAEPVGFLDVTLGPAFVGLAVGRLVALGLDDPSSIGSLSDMLIVRSGVEFWPGIAAAAGVLMWGEFRAGHPPLTRVADIAPLAMVGYAGYEAACVFRDGCFGPLSPVGLRPPGLTTTMLPVGLLMALTVAAGAVVVRRRARRPDRPVVTVLSGVVVVAVVRAVGSIWLPHVGTGLTRQHVTSIVVAVGAMIGLIAVIASARPRRATPVRKL